jgi:hypothetical protein
LGLVTWDQALSMAADAAENLYRQGAVDVRLFPVPVGAGCWTLAGVYNRSGFRYVFGPDVGPLVTPVRVYSRPGLAGVIQ